MLSFFENIYSLCKKAFYMTGIENTITAGIMQNEHVAINEQ